MAHWYTITSLDDLAGFFALKAREMNDIAQQRTGLAKHNYAGQAHAYNDAAILIRNCRMETKGRRRVKQRNNADTTEPQRQQRTAGAGETLPTKS